VWDGRHVDYPVLLDPYPIVPQRVQDLPKTSPELGGPLSFKDDETRVFALKHYFFLYADVRLLKASERPEQSGLCSRQSDQFVPGFPGLV
jgi:hypothetical protein